MNPAVTIGAPPLGARPPLNPAARQGGPARDVFGTLLGDGSAAGGLAGPAAGTEAAAADRSRTPAVPPALPGPDEGAAVPDERSEGEATGSSAEETKASDAVPPANGRKGVRIRPHHGAPFLGPQDFRPTGDPAESEGAAPRTVAAAPADNGEKAEGESDASTADAETQHQPEGSREAMAVPTPQLPAPGAGQGGSGNASGEREPGEKEREDGGAGSDAAAQPGATASEEPGKGVGPGEPGGAARGRAGIIAAAIAALGHPAPAAAAPAGKASPAVPVAGPHTGGAEAVGERAGRPGARGSAAKLQDGLASLRLQTVKEAGETVRPREGAPEGSARAASGKEREPASAVLANSEKGTAAAPSSSIAGSLPIVAPADFGRHVAGEMRAQAAGAPPPAHVAPHHYLPANGMRQIDVHLHPAELGAVTARIRMTGDRLSVAIAAETPEAQRRLAAEENSIRHALEALGFSVDQLSIELPASPSGNAPADQPSAGQREDPARSFGDRAGSGGRGEAGDGAGGNGSNGTGSGHGGWNGATVAGGGEAGGLEPGTLAGGRGVYI